jgi:hypothetical protein
MEALRAELEAGDIAPERATELLERIAALVHEVVDVLERSGETLESGEAPP